MGDQRSATVGGLVAAIVLCGSVCACGGVTHGDSARRPSTVGSPATELPLSSEPFTPSSQPTSTADTPAESPTGAGSPSSQGTSDATQAPTETLPGGPSQPDGAGRFRKLIDYQRRCAELDDHMAASRVVYQARQEMSRGKAAVVTAAVTLDFETPANKVLRRSTAVAEEVFIVSCHLEARLRASHYDFALDSTKWIGRSLLTTDTARWQWYATPKTGGWHVLVLELRPIVRLRPVDEGSASPGSSQTVTDTADLVSYETSVHVSVPWSQRPQEWMTVAAKNLGLAEGLVRALTALLVALAALFTAWRVLRRRSVRPRAALPEDGDGPSPT